MTVDNLHEAITQLLNTASIKEKATELGVKIRNEDGIGAAIAVIESEQ